MKRRVIEIILIVLFILLGILSICNKTTTIDNFIYNIIIFSKNDITTHIMKFITMLASTKAIISYNVILLILIYKYKKKRYLLVLVTTITSVIFNNITKIIFRRPRPIGISLIKEIGYSYPSGHAMIAVLFFGTLCYLIKNSRIKHKKLISWLLRIFIILIGISRIYLGVHYVTDIVGGYLLSMILLMLVVDINKKLKENK